MECLADKRKNIIQETMIVDRVITDVTESVVEEIIIMERINMIKEEEMIAGGAATMDVADINQHT